MARITVHDHVSLLALAQRQPPKPLPDPPSAKPDSAERHEDRGLTHRAAFHGEFARVLQELRVDNILGP